MDTNKPGHRTDGKFYILTKDNQPGASAAGSDSEGTIWQEEGELIQDTVLVSQYDGTGIGTLTQINIKNLSVINLEIVNLLLAIQPPNELSKRIKVFNDRAWIKEGLSIEVGAVVEIYDVHGIPAAAVGTVQYKGALSDKVGTWFGVELSIKYHGLGTTDGTFRKKRLFSCDEDCGIFVSIAKIRLAQSVENSEVNVGLRARGLGEGQSLQDTYRESKSGASAHALDIDERVVWMSDLGPEFGTVKWIGTLPGTNDGKIIVGVDFDNAVGSGTGKYKGNKLFQAQKNHASLIPILGLLRASVYMSMMADGLAAVKEPTIEYSSQDFQVGNNKAANYCQSDDLSLDKLVDEALKIDNNRVERTSSTNTGARPKEPKKSSDISAVTVKHHLFQVGDNVRINFGSWRTGVIRWIGTFPGSKNPDQVIAGLEMNEEDSKCYTEGTFQGLKIFDCPAKKGFFFPLDKCFHT